jgi:hypothetical protein
MNSNIVESSDYTNQKEKNNSTKKTDSKSLKFNNTQQDINIKRRKQVSPQQTTTLNFTKTLVNHILDEGDSGENAVVLMKGEK